MKKIKKFFKNLFKGSRRNKRKVLLQNKYFAMVEMEKELKKAWITEVIDNMDPDAKLSEEMQKHPFKKWIDGIMDSVETIVTTNTLAKSTTKKTKEV